MDKKPKEKQLKDKELEKMYQNITQIFKEIYDEKLLKDFNEFMDDILNKKKFELYINRERLMGEIDLKFNTFTDVYKGLILFFLYSPSSFSSTPSSFIIFLR